jgi:hypothetical protein
MIENRRYALRLKAPFAWYDTVTSQQWHEFPTGYVATDQREIALLESISGAPTEKIYEGEFLR